VKWRICCTVKAKSTLASFRKSCDALSALVGLSHRFRKLLKVNGRRCPVYCGQRKPSDPLGTSFRLAPGPASAEMECSSYRGKSEVLSRSTYLPIWMFPFEWLPCVIDSACVCHHWAYLRSWCVGTSPRLAKFRLWSVITLTLLSQESQRSSALHVRG
jgi:hypothetical protein